MDEATAQGHVNQATEAFKQEREDISVWTIDMPHLNRSVDVVAATEAEARQGVVEYLVSEDSG
jgi:hypothetical protein